MPILSRQLNYILGISLILGIPRTLGKDSTISMTRGLGLEKSTEIRLESMWTPKVTDIGDLGHFLLETDSETNSEKRSKN